MMMNNVYLILGSNIDKERNLPEAVRLLREKTTVVTVSGVYETAPVGLVEQPVFWNTAVLIHTPLSPAEIKVGILSPIERQLKRVRQADKNAPRTIDLDIVLFDEMVLNYDPGDGRFRPIPDPDLLKFAHVAVPMAELAPNLPHPVSGEPLQAIANRLVREQQAAGWPAIFRRSDVTL